MRKCYVVIGINDYYQWVDGVYSSRTKALLRKQYLDCNAPSDDLSYKVITEIIK